jgi:putative endonuclease
MTIRTSFLNEVFDFILLSSMKPIGTHNYFVYIITNENKTVLYTGVTNNLQSRLVQHQFPGENRKHFSARYNVYFPVYWESHNNVQYAIDREKEIKGWKRFKKMNLIASFNPEWKFLNDEIET